MPVPGFHTDQLDESGGVRWANEITGNGFALHVFYGLTPQQALNLLGGKAIRDLEPGELPTESPDEWTTVVHVAIGHASDSDLLVAGQGSGEWSFVYDISGLTAFEMPELTGLPQGGYRGRSAAAADLPPGPRTVATFTCTINGDENLSFSEGDEEHHFNGWDDIRRYEELNGQPIPATLIPAVELAGTFDSEDEDFWDTQVGLRIVCALAGLVWTPDEFRNQRLAVANF